MRKLNLLILTMLCAVLLQAAPKLEAGKRYHIVCQQFTKGCVTDGATARQNTPVYYLPQVTTGDETWWYFTQEDEDVYSIKNAKTGQYVTYDGVRSDSPQIRRYISMTDRKDGNNSLWQIVRQESGIYVIRNVSHNDHLWDVRVSSYCVGTYSNGGNGNSNQRFYFTDEQGRQVAEDLSVKTDPLSNATGQITIDGRNLAYAESLGIYLCPLPQKSFGGNVTAKIGYTQKQGCSLLSIDGKDVEPEASYTFSDIRAGKTWHFAVTTADGQKTNKAVTFTTLPVVELQGSFNYDYSEGYIIVNETDKASSGVLNMKAKWRGGITNGDNKHKRNSHVKLMDDEGNKLDQKFFGLREDNSWILESCQVDMLRIRNRTVTDLWNDYAAPPYYIDQEKKAKTGSRGQFVELILNGEYRGIYCMTEAIDRKQMKLMKYDEDKGVVHGQLWKSKDWSYAVFMGHYSDNNSYPGTSPRNYSNTSESWDQYYVKYPDFEDYGYTTDWSTLYDAVNFVCTSSNLEFFNHFAEYFDLPVVMDYYILMETILATDNHGKNMYFGVYDKQTDKKITFAVWDLDATCGQRWDDNYYHWNGMRPEQNYATYITNNEHGDYNLFRRLRNTNANDFKMQVRLRYRDLRQSYLNTESILNRFRAYLELFKTGGADLREYGRWSYDSDVAGHALDFDTEMAYLEDWFTRRMNYLDKTRFQISDLPPTGMEYVTQSEPESQRSTGVYTLSGQHVTDDTSEQSLHALPSGIYIVNGEKVAVGR